MHEVFQTNSGYEKITVSFDEDEIIIGYKRIKYSDIKLIYVERFASDAVDGLIGMLTNEGDSYYLHYSKADDKRAVESVNYVREKIGADPIFIPQNSTANSSPTSYTNNRNTYNTSSFTSNNSTPNQTNSNTTNIDTSGMGCGIGCLAVMIIAVIIFVVSCIGNSSDTDVMYYQDVNQNGQHDSGEFYWTEDQDGNVTGIGD